MNRGRRRARLLSQACARHCCLAIALVRANVKLARQALEKAIGVNADGARLLLAILRAAPDAVKYKPEDRFGPLGMMVTESARIQPSTAPPRFARPALAPRFHRAAERFREWISREFTKADELERYLRQLGEEVPSPDGGWRTLGRSPANRRDPLRRLFPGGTSRS